jgi:hypothetical protein
MLHCILDLCAMQHYIRLHEAGTPPPSRFYRAKGTPPPSLRPFIENPVHLLPRRVLFLSNCHPESSDAAFPSHQDGNRYAYLLDVMTANASTAEKARNAATIPLTTIIVSVGIT